MARTSAPPTRLRIALDEAGRTQRWLADEVGVDESLMSRYANGLHPPQDRKLLIAQTLRRTVADVFPEAGR